MLSRSPAVVTATSRPTAAWGGEVACRTEGVEAAISRLVCRGVVPDHTPDFENQHQNEIGCTVFAEEHKMMYGYGVNGAGGWWMLAAMAVVAIAIVASVWLIVHRPGVGTPSQSRSSAEEILRERFARGEITGEQFDEAKKRLG
jgi:putative membrane protein